MKLSALTPNTSPALSDSLVSVQNPNTTPADVLVPISDLQSLLAPTTGWNAVAGTLSYSANNGNKEFVLGTSDDLTGSISPGMRLQVTRTTTPPTQCMSFASASSQYATIASPTGTTFTSAFTCEAWIYPLSYTGALQGIISRYNGTNGFGIEVNSSGQVVLFASSTTYQTSYQSIPLNQQVHIAGTFSSGTMVLYINGAIVPSFLTGSATSITQAGALQVGAANSTSFFNGYISEPRIWSVAQTATAIRNNMAINLGATTNLVFGLTPGTWTDVTTNGNNLTAENSASAIYAANPFNAIEYAIVTAVTSSTLTVYAGNSNTIPDMTLSTPYYSSLRSPYGFPAGRNNWIIIQPYVASYSTGTLTPATWSQTSLQITIPTGSWSYGYKLYVQINAGSSASNQGEVCLVSTTPANVNFSYPTTTSIYTQAAQFSGAWVYTDDEKPISSITTYSIYFSYSQSSGTTTMSAGGDSAGALFAKCAYL